MKKETTRRNFLKLVGIGVLGVSLTDKVDAADSTWNAPKQLRVTDIFVYDEQGTYFRFSYDLMLMLRIDP